MANFDIKSYLEEKGIEYKTRGKNTTKGWVNIQCILPNCSDHSNHLGINLKTLAYKCWLCGEKGHVSNLICIIERCSEGVAKQIMRRFLLSEDLFEDEEEEQIQNSTIELPEEIVKEWPQSHLNYLKSRNFDPDMLINKYHLKPVHTMGTYRFRIIIPIFLNYQLVSFTSMDVLREDERPHYLDCPIKKAVIPVKHCLYNFDTVKDKIAIYEGVTGVWRFGDGAVASFTSNFTPEQIALFCRKKIKKAFVIFDPDAKKKGENMAAQLSGFIPSVEQICFSEGDPKDICEEDMTKFKKSLGF